MDGLSAGASCIAVISLAMQLAESLKQLYEFWDSIKNAPKEIETIMKELRLLSAVLDSIQIDQQFQDPSSVLVDALKSCIDKCEELKSIVGELEGSFGSSSRRAKKWGAFKASLRSGKLDKFRASLEETKTTLLLIQQMVASQMIRSIRHPQTFSRHQNISVLQLEYPQMNLASFTSASNLNDEMDKWRNEVYRTTNKSIKNPVIRTGAMMALDYAIRRIKGDPDAVDVSSVQGNENMGTNSPGKPIRTSVPGSGPSQAKRGRRLLPKRQNDYEYVLPTPFGVIRIHCSTYSVRYILSEGSINIKRPAETQTKYLVNIHPAQWILKWGVKYGINAAISMSCCGWQNRLDIYRAVPDDALIFHFCKYGNLEAVKTLLSRGEASVWDTDSRGYMPLHFASENCNAEICQLLLESGADAMALTQTQENFSKAKTPLELSISKVEQAGAQETLRLLLKYTEVWFSTEDPSDSEVHGWNLLAWLWVTYDSKDYYTSTAPAWLLQIFFEEMKANYNSHFISIMLRYALHVRDAQIATMRILLDITMDAGITFEPFSSSSSDLLIYPIIAEWFYLPSLRLATEKIPALLHQEGLVGFCDGFQTPTSIAMTNNVTWYQWRSFIRDYIKYDVKEFVREEILRTSVLKKEGWTEKSLLFLFQYDYTPCLRSRSRYCGRCLRNVGQRELWWENKLELIRLSHFASCEDSVAGPVQQYIDDATTDDYDNAYSSEEDDEDDGFEELENIGYTHCWLCSSLEEKRDRGHQFAGGCTHEM